jgi:ABC-type microcin C transport system duplicated ATPase subunit YejF
LQSHSGCSESGTDIHDLVDILTETIDTLALELQSSTSSGSVGRSGSGPITTIGFDTSQETK